MALSTRQLWARLSTWAKDNRKAATVVAGGGVLGFAVIVVALVFALAGSLGRLDALAAALTEHGWQEARAPELSYRPKFGRYAQQTSYSYHHPKGGEVELVCHKGKILRFQLAAGSPKIEWKAILEAYRPGLWKYWQKLLHPPPDRYDGIKVFEQLLADPAIYQDVAIAVYWLMDYGSSPPVNWPVAFILRDTDYLAVERRIFSADYQRTFGWRC